MWRIVASVSSVAVMAVASVVYLSWPIGHKSRPTGHRAESRLSPPACDVARAAHAGRLVPSAVATQDPTRYLTNYGPASTGQPFSRSTCGWDDRATGDQLGVTLDVYRHLPHSDYPLIGPGGGPGYRGQGLAIPGIGDEAWELVKFAEDWHGASVPAVGLSARRKNVIVGVGYIRHNDPDSVATRTVVENLAKAILDHVPTT